MSLPGLGSAAVTATTVTITKWAGTLLRDLHGIPKNQHEFSTEQVFFGR